MARKGIKPTPVAVNKAEADWGERPIDLDFEGGYAYR
jgi:hypothetical protein